MTSAQGPSLAGPISDRVVKPDGLRYMLFIANLKENFVTYPLPRRATYEAGAASMQEIQFIGFIGRHI